MKKIALCLVAFLLSGCIFLTPATGLRVGDHSGEFAHLQQGTATEVKFLTYEAADFSLVYPDFWSVGRTEAPAGASATMRVGIGSVAESGEAEGLVVTTMTSSFEANLDDANEQLLNAVKDSLGATYTGFSVVKESAHTLGGTPGHRLEAKGADAKGTQTHLLAQTAVRDGKGYIVVMSTTESRFSTFLPLFEHLYERFAFREAGATPAPSGSPAASASPAPSASPAGAATPTPSAS